MTDELRDCKWAGAQLKRHPKTARRWLVAQGVAVVQGRFWESHFWTAVEKVWGERPSEIDYEEAVSEIGRR